MPTYDELRHRIKERTQSAACVSRNQITEEWDRIDKEINIRIEKLQNSDKSKDPNILNEIYRLVNSKNRLLDAAYDCIGRGN